MMSDFNILATVAYVILLMEVAFIWWELMQDILKMKMKRVTVRVCRAALMFVVIELIKHL
jgi:hypothetical protein